MNKESVYEQFGIKKEVLALGTQVLEELSERFMAIDERAEINQLKVFSKRQDFLLLYYPVQNKEFYTYLFLHLQSRLKRVNRYYGMCQPILLLLNLC
mgnify:CR=1 FL=1